MTSERANTMSRKVTRKHSDYSLGEAYWAAKELPEEATVALIAARVESDRSSPYRCPGCGLKSCGGAAA